MLRKRRRAKKIRLRQGSMTLAEGQDIQTQIDVEAQLNVEMVRFLFLTAVNRQMSALIAVEAFAFMHELVAFDQSFGS